MESQCVLQERFRRSGLIIAPEWLLAGLVSLAIGWAALTFELEMCVALAALAGLPLLWATSCTLQWYARSWVARSDGCLTFQHGVLIRHSEVIHLCSVSRVRLRTVPMLGWCNVGHLDFEATDQQGSARPFQLRWLANVARLAEILRARGRLPMGRPSRWERLHAWGAGILHRRAVRVARTPARILGQRARDYGLFMAYCHRLLRSRNGVQPSVPGVPAPVIEIWMAVLRRARIIVDTSCNPGWRIAPSIASLSDIQRRIGQEDFWRALDREKPACLSR